MSACVLFKGSLPLNPAIVGVWHIRYFEGTCSNWCVGWGVYI